ncbi:uncharacterized protein C21orf58-like [Panthera onca]
MSHPRCVLCKEVITFYRVHIHRSIRSSLFLATLLQWMMFVPILQGREGDIFNFFLAPAPLQEKNTIKMLDSSVADEMTGLTLKLWEKKLEQEPKHVEGDSEDTHLRPGNEGRPEWSALRRRKEFPQSTFQHLLEEVSQAQGNGCQQRRSPPTMGIYLRLPAPTSPGATRDYPTLCPPASCHHH